MTSVNTPLFNSSIVRQESYHSQASSSRASTVASQESDNKNHTIRHPVRLFAHRSKTLWSQLNISEISGSVGDLGTFIPLTVALARQRSILLAPALFFAGLANVVTGYVWDVPMCVQPMKAIAAVALADSLNSDEVTAAGMWMGIFCVILGATQLIDIVNIIVPPPVVSGLQMGVGLKLAIKGVAMIAKLGWVNQADCILLAVLSSIMCMYWLREPEETTTTEATGPTNMWDRLTCRRSNRQPPAGLYLFLLGVLFATIELATTDNADGEYDLPLGFFGAPVAVWALDSVSWSEWKTGLLDGAIPQLPLTTLNSVISVCCLAHVLYPERRKGSSTSDAVVSRTEVCVSVGLMNLLLCPFGAMPSCHGAGGLAAQHRLGSRHGAAVVFLGSFKMFLAIFFGASALTLLDALPDAILGVMLVIAGHELASTGLTMLFRDGIGAHKLRQSAVISVITTVVILGVEELYYGVLSGWATHMIYGDGTTDFVRWIRSRYFSSPAPDETELPKVSATNENDKDDVLVKSEVDRV